MDAPLQTPRPFVFFSSENLASLQDKLRVPALVTDSSDQCRHAHSSTICHSPVAFAGVCTLSLWVCLSQARTTTRHLCVESTISTILTERGPCSNPVMYYLTNHSTRTPSTPSVHISLNAGTSSDEILSKDQFTNHDRRQVRRTSSHF